MDLRKIILKLLCVGIVLLSFTINYGYSQNLVKNDSLSVRDIKSSDHKSRIYNRKGVRTRRVWVDNINMNLVKNASMPDKPGGLGTYYVSPSGNDLYSGLSEAEAWQTIDKVNNMDFYPGDEILFEGGRIFTGNILFDSLDVGTAQSSIVLGSYGTGRATIDAKTGNGLLAINCDNLSIKNLKFIGDGRNTGNSGDGIIFSLCSNIHVDSVEISGFQHSGLLVDSIGHGYSLKNINAHDNGYAGICILGSSKTSVTDVYIGYCTADNNPGDPTVLNNHSGNGIFAFNASNVTIEYCEASNNGAEMPRKGNGPGGIWVAEVDSAIIQYCISHDNKTSPGADDGLGFDLDGGTTNSIIQYCLSYNNQGAGYGIFQYAVATNWYNNTVRYCISENDGNGSAPGSMLFWNGSGDKNKFKNFEFYNNVIYNANGAALAYYDHNNLNFNFRNNIFVSKESGVYNRISGENSQGNCWFSLDDFYSDSLSFIAWAQANNQEMLEGEIIGMFANPLLVNPGSSTLSNPTLLPTVNDYKVVEGSPVIDAGLDLELLFAINTGNRDYFGNHLQQGQAFNMGIHQFFDKQLISFTTGWNIMSANLLPANPDLESVFQSLISNGSLLKIQDESGNSIEQLGINSDWMNNIGDISLTEGYKVKVGGDDSIQVYGPPKVNYPYAIPLKTGWNIIGYPQIKDFDGLDVVQELIDRNTLIKVQDKSGNSIEYLEINSAWTNNIGNFVAGDGYKIKVIEDDTLWIYDSYPKSATVQQEKVMASHFIPAFKGNGSDHMNIYLVNPAESGLQNGDEIGIFDGNVCVGSAKINFQLPIAIGTTISIPVSAADGNESKNGYTAGNNISLRLFRKGAEYPLTIEPVNNRKLIFEKGGTLLIKLGLATGVDDLKTDEGIEINCYPNPFNNEITIKIYLLKDTEIEVEVLNQLGQCVNVIFLRQKMTSGWHKFIWDGRNNSNQKESPGIYHLRINVDEIVIHKKIIYLAM